MPTYNIIGSGGILANSSAMSQAVYNVNQCLGEQFDASFSMAFAIVPRCDPFPGSIGGGRATHTYYETGFGVVVASGSALPAYGHLYVETDCADEPQAVRCAYSNDDQFCANFYLIQGIGSRFMNPQRLNLTATPLKPFKDYPVYGSSAKVAATTFCLQKIRPRPKDQKPKTVLAPEPVQPVDDQNNLMMLANMPLSFPTQVAKPDIINLRHGTKNTPQMAQLKKQNQAIKDAQKTEIPARKLSRPVKPTKSVKSPVKKMASAL